ncbi:MAG: Gfo/Idh/MocA family protein [Acidobacteriota bacterium]
MTRRAWIASSLALAAAPRLPVAVIGHTGRGNFGHGIDTVWRSFPQLEVVAISDPDPAGRAAAQSRTGALRAYSDFREMLAQEKPFLVGIGPRHADQRLLMLSAAVAAGCHIYMEKPFAATLADADPMVQAVQRHGVKLQIAHQMRRSPYALEAQRLITSGDIGEVEQIRCHGKEDRRAGGEDMAVLGSHLFDMMRFFLGDPLSVSARVTHNGRNITRADARSASEPVGPIAGNQITATFTFPGGIPAFFTTRAVADTHPWRFGTWIYGSRGVICLPNGIYPDGGLHILRSASWIPSSSAQWQSFPPPAEHQVKGSDLANSLMVTDLLAAIESNSRPCCNEIDGRWTTEMIQGVYLSHLTGRHVDFPLTSRQHPLL